MTDGQTSRLTGRRAEYRQTPDTERQNSINSDRLRILVSRIPRSKMDSQLLDMLQRLGIADVIQKTYAAIWREKVRDSH